MNAYGRLLDPTTLRIERLLPGPIEQVWAYLVEPDKRAEWLAGGAMELKPGGRAEFIFDHRNLTDEKPPEKYKNEGGEMRFEGKVLKAEPPRRLRISWPEMSGDISEVEFELASRGSDVMLTITHTKLVQRSDLLGTSAGWHTHLDVLAAKLAGRPHTTFWSGLVALEEEYDKRFA
jgi:uncharacterized protein YndB with AHSA1/START domain